MKKNLFLFIILTAFGCDTIIDANVPVEAPKLTLNSMFTPDSVWTVQLSKSRYILEDTEFSPVTNANVVVYHNDSPFDTLTQAEDGLYSSTKNRKPVIGEYYQIKANAPGLEAVKSISYAPPYGELTNLELKAKPGQSSYDEPNCTIKVTFNDDGTTEDFYEFEVYGKFTTISYPTQETIERYYPVNIEATESDSEDAVIFDDHPYNGKEVTISIGAYVHNGAKDNLYLHFRKLSKELYQYRSSSLHQTQSSGDPLAQPVHVYNNISGGYGIFGGYSERVYELKN